MKTISSKDIPSTGSFQQRCQTTVCRCCGRKGLLPILDLGMMPLTAAFVPADKLDAPEPRFPLEVAFCPDCTLVQITETVPPDQIFHADYPYYSSFSDALLAHAKANVEGICSRFPLGKDSLVVELASNDGYLLKNFVEKGIPVLGIDPAPGPAKAAEKIGVPTMCAFFGKDLAARLKAEGRQADVVIANNVMAHVADTSGFVAGIRTLLKDGGTLVTESPYLRNMIEHTEFDTIYHEHLCYYGVTALNNLFRRNGLFLNDIEVLPNMHGGSLRLYAGTVENVQPIVRQFLEQEKQLGMTRIGYYQDFARKVESVRDGMLKILADVKKQGKRVAAYGAAAKGVILLNYIGVGPEVIEYCVDRNVHKQGKFLPGLKMPVADPKRLVEDKPDYVVVLAWNFKDEIIRQQRAYAEQGGKFIVPIPNPAVL